MSSFESRGVDLVNGAETQGSLARSTTFTRAIAALIAMTTSDARGNVSSMSSTTREDHEPALESPLGTGSAVIFSFED